MNRKAPPSKMQTTRCKRAACGLAVPPYQRAKPINLPSNAMGASRGRPPAFFETLARPSTLRASRLRIPRKKIAFRADGRSAFLLYGLICLTCDMAIALYTYCYG